MIAYRHGLQVDVFSHTSICGDCEKYARISDQKIFSDFHQCPECKLARFHWSFSLMSMGRLPVAKIVYR